MQHIYRSRLLNPKNNGLLLGETSGVYEQQLTMSGTQIDRMKCCVILLQYQSNCHLVF